MKTAERRKLLGRKVTERNWMVGTTLFMRLSSEAIENWTKFPLNGRYQIRAVLSSHVLHFHNFECLTLYGSPRRLNDFVYRRSIPRLGENIMYSIRQTDQIQPEQ